MPITEVLTDALVTLNLICGSPDLVQVKVHRMTLAIAATPGSSRTAAPCSSLDRRLDNGAGGVTAPRRRGVQFTAGPLLDSGAWVLVPWPGEAPPARDWHWPKRSLSEEPPT
jgi:hypothetical protein